MPPSMPELMWPSRCSWQVCSANVVNVVTPSTSTSVVVFIEPASGKPSNTSVLTIRYGASSSWYTPFQPNSVPCSSRTT